MSVRAAGWAYLSDFGNRIHEIDSRFDCRNHGHEKLSGILKESGRLEISPDGRLKML
jgi:hypothetical protein